MPIEIFNQLKTLREGIAETLRKDPRYLTLHALDKSIAEIGGVLRASGLMAVADAADMPSPFSVELGAVVPPSSATAGPPPATSGKASTPKPPANGPDVLASAGVASDLHAEAQGKPLGTTASNTTKPVEEDEGDSDEEPEPAAALPALVAEASAETHDPAPLLSSEEPAPPGGEAHAVLDPLPDRPPAEAAPLAEQEQHTVTAALPEQRAMPAAPSPTEPTSGAFQGWASGYRPMTPKPGAAQFQPSIAVKFGRLPGTVDLRPLLSPIEDQGEIRSCVASAAATAYEAWIRKAHKRDEPVSRLFIYYNARWREGIEDEDEGSAIQLAMESLCKFGACSEAVWPFDSHLVLKKPGAAAYEAAAAYRVADIARVPLKLDAWKQALAEGKPIVFGCELFESFEGSSRRGGVVPMPEPADVARAGHSGHAMCAVGYSDTEMVFLVRNSWSAQWGDGGYCYMPYAYLMSATFNDGDCWVFVPKVPLQPPRETWSDSTSPLTNGGAGVAFSIETHPVEDYQESGVDLLVGARHPFPAEAPEGYAAYVDAVSQGRWVELESFDAATYLAVAAALTDVDLFEDDSVEAEAKPVDTPARGNVVHAGGDDRGA